MFLFNIFHHIVKGIAQTRYKDYFDSFRKIYIHQIMKVNESLYVHFTTGHSQSTLVNDTEEI